MKTKHKLCDTASRYKSCRKTLNKVNHFRYLGAKIDKNPNWKTHVHDLASKLNIANSVSSKQRSFVINYPLNHFNMEPSIRTVK